MITRISILQEALRSCYKKLGGSFDRSDDFRHGYFYGKEYSPRAARCSATDIVIQERAIEVNSYSSDVREWARQIETFSTLRAFLINRMEIQIDRYRMADFLTISHEILLESGISIVQRPSHELSVKAWKKVDKMSEKRKRDMSLYITLSPRIIWLCILYFLSRYTDSGPGLRA